MKIRILSIPIDISMTTYLMVYKGIGVLEWDEEFALDGVLQ
jgi:hypothetical protein